MTTTTRDELSGLTALTAEMEAKAIANGGIAFSACQNEWGIEPREIDGEPGQWELRDCDGEVWARGTAGEIMARRDRLVERAGELAAESNQNAEDE